MWPSWRSASGAAGEIVEARRSSRARHDLLHYMNIFVDTLIETQFMVDQAEMYPDLVLDAVVAPTELLGDR